MKAYSLSFLAIVLALAAVAFSPSEAEDSAGNDLYYFSFEGTIVQEQSDPENYIWLEGGPTVQCGTEGELHCVIRAEKDQFDLPILEVNGMPAFEVLSTREP